MNLVTLSFPRWLVEIFFKTKYALKTNFQVKSVGRALDLMILPSWFQLLIDGSVPTVVLDGLRPQTEYNVKVYAVVDELSSEPVRGAETTCKFSTTSSTSSSSSSSLFPSPLSPAVGKAGFNPALLRTNTPISRPIVRLHTRPPSVFSGCRNLPRRLCFLRPGAANTNVTPRSGSWWKLLRGTRHHFKSDWILFKVLQS